MLGNGLADTVHVDNNVCISIFARLGVYTVLFFKKKKKKDLAVNNFGW